MKFVRERRSQINPQRFFFTSEHDPMPFVFLSFFSNKKFSNESKSFCIRCLIFPRWRRREKGNEFLWVDKWCENNIKRRRGRKCFLLLRSKKMFIQLVKQFFLWNKFRWSKIILMRKSDKWIPLQMTSLSLSLSLSLFLLIWPQGKLRPKDQILRFPHLPPPSCIS